MIENARGSERRRFPRAWIRRRGQLIVVKGLRNSIVIGCQVLNTSKGGALIQVDRASDVPDDFYLVMDGQGGQMFTCSVARRGQRLLGVRFVPQSRTSVRIVRGWA